MALSSAAAMSKEQTQIKLNTTIKKMGLIILSSLWIFVHRIIDSIIDLIFGVIYPHSKKKLIPEIQNDILLKSACTLASSIRRRELTSVAVVKAFAQRIREVNTAINAVVDDRIEAALAEASQVDKLFDTGMITEAEAKASKPFLGVPFTTKESTSCKGMSFTMGLVARYGLIGEEDAEVVRLLKEAGGILIAVTNIPELNLWCETRCIPFGQTNNPYNTTRTVGGSSGGEAAILTTCGSPMGIGSDIGGSIRMPAFYCGIFGHKPTTGLITVKGLSFRTGEEGDTMVCAGPMSKHAEDLTPLLKILVGRKVDLLQLDTKVNLSDICVMYVEESGDLRASSLTSEMKGVMHRVVHHFETISSYPVEKLNLPGFRSSFRLWRYCMSKEPGNFARDITNRQREVNVWQEIRLFLTGCGNHTLPAVLNLCDKKLFPSENSAWAESTIKRLESDLLEKLGRNGVLLYPSHPFPASFHYSSFLRPYNFGYWAIFNVLRFPVTQVPLGLSRDGLPIGIQVVAAPYQDHLCLTVARELELKFGGWVSPSPVKV